jgi:hypothetical protein
MFFFTYLRRELRRRMRQAVVTAAGPALGIGLVITVIALSSRPEPVHRRRRMAGRPGTHRARQDHAAADPRRPGPAQHGTATFDGHDLDQLREAQVTRLRATSIGFILQTFNLVPTRRAAR